MPAVSTLRNNKYENQGETLDISFSINGVTTADDGSYHEHYNSFINENSGDTNFLDSIDFDDIFLGINDVDSLLPDLEMDPDILAKFSLPGPGNDQVPKIEDNNDDSNNKKKDDGQEDKLSGSGSGLTSSTTSSFQEEILSIIPESDVVTKQSTKESADRHKTRSSKSSAYNSKNSQGKRKVKVDWTPELHRRFVQAVERLGVDKAVPSRILEHMGIDCLTRHNIASHLQKYRSHRKHMLAREADAASWNQRQQMYGSVAGGGGGGGKKEMMNPNLLLPTMGFPSVTPMHHFRPLHVWVWGHPPIHDQPLPHIWPKHHPHSPPPPAITWPPSTTPPLLSPNPNSCWQHRVLSTHQAVPGFPPHAVYKVASPINGLHPTGQSVPRSPSFDIYPSKESVDVAIGDVLSKPGLPLPLGLKPPSHESWSNSNDRDFRRYHPHRPVF